MSDFEGWGEKPRDLGLKAVRDARIERSSKKRLRMSSRGWLLVIGSALSVVLGSWLFRERSLDTAKAELLSKQRAAAATVGAEWTPLRDKMEALAATASGDYKGDFVDPELAGWDFRKQPGIYLRLRVEDAKNVAVLRKKADDSLRDSFVGCLLRENNPSSAAVARGETDAGSGWNDQPWNLRLAYFATRTLSDDWADEVKRAEDELHLRVFVQQYDKALAELIPLSIDIVKKAQFFLLVLDEDTPEANDLVPDGGKLTERELQQVPHPSRVHLLDLRRGKEMLRLRRSSQAAFQFVGDYAYRDPVMLGTMKRQVNNCALARDVLDVIEPRAAKGDAGH